MTYKVLLTDDAARDLEELHRYIAEQDAPAAADGVLDRIEKYSTTWRHFLSGATTPRSWRRSVCTTTGTSFSNPIG